MREPEYILHGEKCVGTLTSTTPNLCWYRMSYYHNLSLFKRLFQHDDAPVHTASFTEARAVSPNAILDTARLLSMMG